MALKDLMNAVKKEGVVTKRLDLYLMQKMNEGNDRAINVNAPSQAGNCIRCNYYARMGYESEGEGGDIARTQRIFDNGTHVHLRLQDYLMKEGILLLDEVPLINDEYKIQGHTDGYLDLGDGEIGILEIKSINSNGFEQLKDIKEAHKRQGFIYLYCAEERRKYLNTFTEYENSLDFRAEYFEAHYQHMQAGGKYTREQKIENEVELNLVSDDILYYKAKKPISKVVFLYENKDNQMLKEFVLERNFATEGILTEVLNEYKLLNEYCEKEEVPPREGKNKSDSLCRWCNYKNECWVV